jgi:citrate lyase subunit beta / citryl-CoA lyase
MDIQHARSLLFVPGDRPDRFDKAVATGADFVIIDLEDAVAPQQKAAAREAAASWLQDHPGVVRINDVNTPWCEADLAALTQLTALVAVMLPKAQDVVAVAEVANRMPAGVPLIALIETARGLSNSQGIGEVPGVARLAFGAIDFAVDMGITTSPDESELAYARSALVVAARTAGLPGPIDGVETQLDDNDRLRATTGRARNLGFTGKLCVHPRQVEIVNNGFRPSDTEIDWATKVLAANKSSAGAAVRVDAEMIDVPQVKLAEGIIRRAGL